MKGLEVQLSRESPQYLPQVTKISDLLARAIQSTRSLARGLAPVNLERGGLPEALKHLAARCTDMYNLQCTFSNGGQKLPDLEEGAATHLYRVAQEATTNAARYARAKSIDDRAALDGTQAAAVDRGRRHRARPPASRRAARAWVSRSWNIARACSAASISFEEPGAGTRIVLSAPLHLLRQSKDKLSEQARELAGQATAERSGLSVEGCGLAQ